MKKVLIIGQGLAGTTLSHALIQQGCDVTVLDKGHETASSMVAAGMWNPIVFKRLNKSWLADDLLPVLREFYSELEKLLGEKLLYDLNVIRIFPDKMAGNDFSLRMEESAFQQYMDLWKNDDLFGLNVIPHGAGIIKQSGRLDVKLLITSYRKYLRSSNSLLEEDFDESALRLGGEKVGYKEWTFDCVVFCQGSQNLKNKWFGEVPLRPVKGEILTIRSEEIPFDQIVNNGRFILPTGKNEFMIGSTYDWFTDDVSPTTEARELLLSKMKSLLPQHYSVVDQVAGIRPTVKDRRPLLGAHPDEKRLLIFNGLGTKGVMLAPYFSRMLTKHILHGEKLHPEVDIQRYLQ